MSVARPVPHSVCFNRGRIPFLKDETMKIRLLIALCVALVVCDSASAGFISRIRARRQGSCGSTAVCSPTASCGASGTCGTPVQAAPVGQPQVFYGGQSAYQFGAAPNCTTGNCQSGIQRYTLPFPAK